MKTAIALGTFDGLHLGHRAVIEKTLPYESVAVTFTLPPKSVISGKYELLILPHERERRLKQLGVKHIVMQNFCDVQEIEAAEYLEKLKSEYNPSLIACGYNYRFGKNAKGDVNLLAKFCKNNNIEFSCVEKQTSDGDELSSTSIREMIKMGEIARASDKIYGGFSFTADVSHGQKRGRTIGFPTANQIYPDMLVKPKFGVYLTKVTVGGKEYRAITNIGTRPTFETETIGCESYIKNFSGEIYGKQMNTELLEFIREEKKFNNIKELQQAIKNDVALLGK